MGFKDSGGQRLWRHKDADHLLEPDPDVRCGCSSGGMARSYRNKSKTMNLAQAKTDAHLLAERLRELSANKEGRSLEDVLALLPDLADVADGIEATLTPANFSEPKRESV